MDLVNITLSDHKDIVDQVFWSNLWLLSMMQVFTQQQPHFSTSRGLVSDAIQSPNIV
jgi:hypothetical protein